MSSEPNPELNEHETLVLGILVREVTKWGQPVQVGAICEIAWANGRGINYSRTREMLTTLVGRGVIYRPTSTTYMPVPLG